MFIKQNILLQIVFDIFIFQILHTGLYYLWYNMRMFNVFEFNI